MPTLDMIECLKPFLVPSRSIQKNDILYPKRALVISFAVLPLLTAWVTLKSLVTIQIKGVTFSLPIKRKEFCPYLLEYLRQAATHHLHIVCVLCKIFELRLSVYDQYC